MPSYIYKPECPYANERGIVEKNDEYYMWLSFNTKDSRMMNGNRPVEMRFISDSMDPTMHMSNGKLYTSKKKFRDETRARGCIEVGNEGETLTKKRAPVKLDRKQRREDIKKSIYQLRNGQIS